MFYVSQTNVQKTFVVVFPVPRPYRPLHSSLTLKYSKSSQEPNHLWSTIVSTTLRFLVTGFQFSDRSNILSVLTFSLNPGLIGIDIMLRSFLPSDIGSHVWDTLLGIIGETCYKGVWELLIKSQYVLLVSIYEKL